MATREFTIDCSKQVKKITRVRDTCNELIEQLGNIESPIILEIPEKPSGDIRISGEDLCKVLASAVTAGLGKFKTGGYISPGRCVLHPIEDENPMLPPEGLELKVGDWVELWNGKIFRLIACICIDGNLESVNGGASIRPSGHMNNYQDGPNAKHVRRLIPRYEAPPYLEWVKAVVREFPTNCKVQNIATGEILSTVGFFDGRGTLRFVDEHGGCRNTDVSRSKGVTLRIGGYRIVPTDWDAK